MEGLLQPELNDNSFISASGKRYTIHPTLSTARFQQFEQLEAEISLCSGAARAQVEKLYNALNASKFADATVTAYNLLNNLTRINEGQESRILLACTLFILSDGEDVAQWNEPDATEKIRDWSNIDVSFFLTCYRYFLTAFTAAYKQNTPNFLEYLNDLQGSTQTPGEK